MGVGGLVLFVALMAGRAAYMWVAPFMLPEVQNRPLLEGLRAERIFQGYGGMLVRLAPAEGQG